MGGKLFQSGLRAELVLFFAKARKAFKTAPLPHCIDTRQKLALVAGTFHSELSG